ncbi:hypothetical protein WA026_005362 [Henosepilachna vigintioctopunctata]|uniref:Uncharacterized protein n=1 Tax=Henosepilachna vigintioctopunctata TaxID=420089 RepID=A0AAW1U1F4_9CUCU
MLYLWSKACCRGRNTRRRTQVQWRDRLQVNVFREKNAEMSCSKGMLAVRPMRPLELMANRATIKERTAVRDGGIPYWWTEEIAGKQEEVIAIRRHRGGGEAKWRRDPPPLMEELTRADKCMKVGKGSRTDGMTPEAVGMIFGRERGRHGCSTCSVNCSTNR